MADFNVYQQLGELQAKVDSLEERTADMDNKLDTLLIRSAIQNGARRMIWKVGASSSAGGGILVAVLQWVSSLRGPHP